MQNVSKMKTALIVRSLEVEDASALSAMLRAQSQSYTRFSIRSISTGKQ
jgi:hypothetical protein